MLLIGLLAAACVATETAVVGMAEGDGSEPEPDGVEVVRTTIVPTMRPSTAEELGIVLDLTGRPYDNDVGPQGATIENRLLGGMTIDRGRLYLVDGKALVSPSGLASADKTTVNFRGITDLEVRVVWQREEGDEPPDETILAVRIGVEDKTVAEWGRFKDGYSTRSGLGGVISRTSFEFGRDQLEPDVPLLDHGLVEGRSFLLADVTGEPGRDVLLFDNGTGAGEYRYTEGFDEDGEMVAIMIWHPRHPWRDAVTEGEPPPDVIEREQELQDCIDGRRAIDRWGRCT